MAIDRLPAVSTVTAADSIALFSAALGADARATLTALLTWLQAQLTASSSLITQYASPNATAFNIAVAPLTAGASVWLLLTPTAGFAAGTITLPAQASCVDGQELLVSCTQAITALTVAGNGSTVNGGPTTLAANTAFRMRFDGVSKAWFRA
jgi:hypothetical protein